MARLGSTIARLASLRTMVSFGLAEPARDRLCDMTGFGSNPGALRARTYLPDALPPGAPLVVVLHGCTQDAAGYDQGAGWSQVADELGFALLFPEQQRSNNPNLCFNWFSAADARRDRGETVSIRQMIDAMVASHALDPQRIFVTGLSAGGAMASILLAAYPELFAAGAIIAGLPFGGANSLGDALTQMRGRGYPTDDQLGALVRGASLHHGPWPRVSVWQGSTDTTVDPANADRIVAQWLRVHDIDGDSVSRDVVDGYPRQVWYDDRGRAVIESYQIVGMGHGTPLDTIGPEGCGDSGPFMVEVGISSTRHIARFWELSEAVAATVKPARDSGVSPSVKATDRRPALPESAPVSPTPVPVRPFTMVGAIIEDALRAAGLMR